MPRVLNRSKGLVVAEKVKVAGSFWARLRGLLGRRRLAPEQGLYLPSASSIHTFFMSFPIDVVFLDRDGYVHKVAASLRPFRVALASGASGALELAAGTAARAGVEVGDVLAFSDDA
jgi:uncharacterized membrane protein (UPF0127 family)